MKRQPKVTESPERVNVFSRSFRGAFAAVSSATAELLGRVEAVERRLVRQRPGGGVPLPGITIPAIIDSSVSAASGPNQWIYRAKEAMVDETGERFKVREGGFVGQGIINLYEVSVQPPLFGYGWERPAGVTVEFLKIPDGAVIALHFTTDEIEQPAEGTPLRPGSGSTGTTDPSPRPRPYFMAPNPILILCDEPEP